MLKILIVDDDINKIGSLKEIILSTVDQNNVDIEYTMEITEAYKFLQQKRYDLVILDIKLPEKMGKNVIESGGVQILKMINTVDRVIKPAYVVGLTSFSESLGGFEKEFTDSLWSLIKYDKTSEEWKTQIAKKVKYIEDVKRSLEEEIKYSSDYEYDFAIITAVQTEYESLINLDINWRDIEMKNECISFKEAEVVFPNRRIKLIIAKQNQMGLPAASVLSEKLINNFRPRFLCMIGIAAGRIGEVELGDLIIAAESWDYGSGKIKMNEEKSKYIFEPDSHQIAIDMQLRSYFDKNHADKLYRIRSKWNNQGGKEIKQDVNKHVGSLASGAAVIQHEGVLSDFIVPHNRKVLGLDMETYGVYLAAINSRRKAPKFFSIKAVCDFANSDKNDNFQKYSAFVSANYFQEIIEELSELF